MQHTFTQTRDTVLYLYLLLTLTHGSFSSKAFILVSVEVNPEAMSGTLVVRREHPVYGMAVHHVTPYTQTCTQTLTHTSGKCQVENWFVVEGCEETRAPGSKTQGDERRIMGEMGGHVQNCANGNQSSGLNRGHRSCEAETIPSAPPYTLTIPPGREFEGFFYTQ